MRERPKAEDPLNPPTEPPPGRMTSPHVDRAPNDHGDDDDDDDEEWEQVVSQPRFQRKPEKRLAPAPLFPDSPSDPSPSPRIDFDAMQPVALFKAPKEQALAEGMIQEGNKTAEEVAENDPVLTPLGTTEVHPLQTTHSELSILEALEREKGKAKTEERLERALGTRSPSPLPLVEHGDDQDVEDGFGGGNRRSSTSSAVAEESWNPFAAGNAEDGVPSPSSSPRAGLATSPQKQLKPPKEERKITINTQEFGKGKSLNAILKLTPKQRQKLWLQIAQEKAREHNLVIPPYQEIIKKVDTLDENDTDVIEKDIPRTGVHPIFDKKSGQASLRRVLMAFTAFNSDIGYCQSLSMIAAEILLVMALNEEESFVVLTSFVRFYFPEYFTDKMKGLLIDLEVFHVLLADRNPGLYVHLKALSDEVGDPPIINPFVGSWLSSLLVSMLPHAKLIRLWDAIFVEGPEMILRYCLGIFVLMERDLMKLTAALDFYTTITSLPELLQDPQCPLFPGHSVLQLAYSLSKFPFPGMRHLRSKLANANDRKISAKGIVLQRENTWDDLSTGFDLSELANYKVTDPKQTGLLRSFSGANAHLQKFLASSRSPPPTNRPTKDLFSSLPGTIFSREPSTSAETDPGRSMRGRVSSDPSSSPGTQMISPKDSRPFLTAESYSSTPLSSDGGSSHGGVDSVDSLEKLNSFSIITDEDYAGFEPAVTEPESSYLKLKELTMLKNPDANEKIKEMAERLDAKGIDLAVERYLLWDAEDASWEEQNELILDILETSPQAIRGPKKEKKKATRDQPQPSSLPKSSEWVPNLGRIGRMMGIAPGEEKLYRQALEQQQQAPPQSKAKTLAAVMKSVGF